MYIRSARASHALSPPRLLNPLEQQYSSQAGLQWPCVVKVRAYLGEPHAGRSACKKQLQAISWTSCPLSSFCQIFCLSHRSGALWIAEYTSCRQHKRQPARSEYWNPLGDAPVSAASTGSSRYVRSSEPSASCTARPLSRATSRSASVAERQLTVGMMRSGSRKATHSCSSAKEECSL